MAPSNSSRAEKLVSLAENRFGANLRDGELAILRGEYDATGGSGGLRPVRSELLQWLVTDPDTRPLLPQGGIPIQNAFFIGSLDLSRCTATTPLYFNNCHFDDSINLNYATVTNVMFDGATLFGGLTAFGVHIQDFLIFQKCDCSGGLSLPFASIDGRFACNYTSLNSNDIAIDLTSAVINGDVLLLGCRASGLLRMSSINVSGNIELSGTSITTTGTALLLDGGSVKGNLLIEKVTTNCVLAMSEMQIGGTVSLSNSILDSPNDVVRLEASRIGGDLVLDGLKSAGAFRLLDGRIGGSLWSRNTVFHTSKDALIMNYAVVENGIFLTPGLESEGSVYATGVKVGADVDITGAQLKASDAGLNLERADIRGSLIANSLRTSGSVHMPGAQLGGDLQFNGAQIGTSGTTNTGLRMDHVEVRGAAMLRSNSCNDRFRTHAVLAIQANINGDLDCAGSMIHVIDCSGIVVGGRWIWTGMQGGGDSELFLQGAKLNGIHDDRASWPGQGKLHVSGLTYNELVTHVPLTCDFSSRHQMEPALSTNSSERIEWLKRQPKDEQLYSQPWNQLAKFLETKGDPAGSRHVLYEFQLLQAKSGNAMWRPEREFFSFLVEDPFRSAEAIGALWFVGFLVFWRYRRMMVPSNPDAYRQFKSGELPSHYVRFHPAIYTLENVLPVVKLGQDSAWQADPGRRQDRRRLKSRRRLYLKLRESGHCHLWLFWLLYLPLWIVHLLGKTVPRSMRGGIYWAKRRWTKSRAAFLLLPPSEVGFRTADRGPIRTRYFTLSLMRWVLIILGWILALVFAAAVTRYFKS